MRYNSLGLIQPLILKALDGKVASPKFLFDNCPDIRQSCNARNVQYWMIKMYEDGLLMRVKPVGKSRHKWLYHLRGMTYKSIEKSLDVLPVRRNFRFCKPGEINIKRYKDPFKQMISNTLGVHYEND